MARFVEKLPALKAALGAFDLRQAFAADARRFEKFHLQACGLHLDYSKHWISDEVWRRLGEALEDEQLPAAALRLKQGAAVNTTEGRAATHMDCRQRLSDEQHRMLAFVDAVLSGRHKTPGGKNYQFLLHIGMGGSDLGPRLVVDALKNGTGLSAHFVANADAADLQRSLAACVPDETLVVVTSKTFSTQETLLNAATTRAWLDSAVGAEAARHHMLAITSDALRATDMGFFPHNIYTFPASVGGRFCLWSCAGFAIAAGCGVADYRQLLAGASAMDAHFLSAPLLHNMPMMMAALGCWYRNGWGLHAQGALPYAERLRLLPAWLQQLEMESNGKSASTLSPVPATAPLLFGGTGTCMQHSFGQWLHQGSDIVPVDFIGVLVDDRQSPEHHRVLFAHLLAQSQGLMKGRSVAELQRAGVDAALHQHKFMPGNRPSSILLLSRLDAYHLGALLALYEHKTYVQSVLWGLNAFDQWGVELGKELQTPLLAALSGGAVPEGLDASTHANLNLFLKK